jgi:murein L,D-transpeptidase YcbB/YkuD
MMLRAALLLAAALAVSASASAQDSSTASGRIATSQPATANQPAADSSSELQFRTDAVYPPVTNFGSAAALATASTSAADGVSAALRSRLADAPSARGRDKTEHAAITSFYEAREYRPLWVDGSALSQSARGIIEEIKRSDAWGLDPADFALPSLARDATDEQRADAEIELDLALLKYARFARGGRLDPASLTKYLDRTPPVLEPRVVLDRISAVTDSAAFLRGLHPKHVQFERLRQKYLAMRQASPVVANVPRVGDGPKLDPGMRHAQIALVRQRLGLPFVGTPGDETLYDQALFNAVKDFQASSGLKKTTGTIDAPTRQALNGIERGSPRRLLANMEEWRWMPEELGDYYVWVNIPEFLIRVVQNGRIIHTERIVVGKTDAQTPIFSDEMEQVIFHPFWGVPDSIKKNELQPNLANGGQILARQGLRVQYRGRDIDPESVDWRTIDMRTVHIYQPPGASNVLGVVKFRFPNKHDVYFHDTPSKSLFAASVRTFSHGCMRVQNPVKLAELILAHDKSMSPERVRSLAAPGSPQNNQINLSQKIPVHITYFTASVDDDGTTHFRNDIYGHEERISLALEGKMNLIAKVREPRGPAPMEGGPRYASKSSDTPGWIKNLFNF